MQCDAQWPRLTGPPISDIPKKPMSSGTRLNPGHGLRKRTRPANASATDRQASVGLPGSSTSTLGIQNESDSFLTQHFVGRGPRDPHCLANVGYLD